MNRIKCHNLTYFPGLKIVSEAREAGLLSAEEEGRIARGEMPADFFHKDSIKEGEPMAVPMGESVIFDDVVVNMVDVGEQTGALPEMLLKIADTYDEEVDNAVAAMTSLLEPIMIVCLAVIVGSIVIAMFMPLIDLMNRVGDTSGGGKKDE